MINIKILYFSPTGKRLSREKLDKAMFVQFVGTYGQTSIDEFFELPPQKKIPFINHIINFLEDKYKVKKYVTKFYNSRGTKLTKKDIKLATYFSIHYEGEELFADKFPPRTKSEEKLLITKETVDFFKEREAKRLEKERNKKPSSFEFDAEGFTEIKNLPINTKIKSSKKSRTFEKTQDADLHGVEHHAYICDLDYSNLVFEGFDETMGFISSQVHNNYKKLITERNVKTGKKGKEEDFYWRIILSIKSGGVVYFTMSSSIVPTIAEALNELSDKLFDTYDDSMVEQYGTSIYDLFLGRIKIIMYDNM